MSEFTRVTFDESLPILVKGIVEELGQKTLEQGLIVRDSSGRLLFLTSDAPPPAERRAAIEKKIADRLGPYARADGVIGFADEPAVERWLADTAALPIEQGTHSIRLLDRRVVGSGWMESPREKRIQPPCVVFASLKGGVGRSTAVALTASDLARHNRNVLILDLDLEGPGIGGMLLDEERTPRFGIVDFLVENGLNKIPNQALANFVGTSTLTSSGGGRVDVVPALGTTAIDHPDNTLAKLARAMIEDIGPTGDATSVPAKIIEMVERFVRRESYDAVLVDSRAGLSELAAPVILGLGGTVLFFGTAQRQTIHGYAALFASLKLLAQRARTAGSRAEWRLRFKAVLAKAGSDPKAAAWYRDEMYDIFAENLYDKENIEQPDPNSVSFNIDDTEAPHWPLVIPFDPTFVDFDPVRAPTQLEAPFYERAYRPFLDSIQVIITSIEDTLDRRKDEP
jgi:hypothetical protein